MQVAHQALMEVNYKISLIVGDPQEILDEHLKPKSTQIHLFNINIIILVYYVKLYIY